MSIRCPSCQTPLEIAQVPTDLLTSISSIECPNCGLIPLNLDQSTISYQQTRDTEPLERIAHFDLIRLLGRGSFGSVWLAHDTVLDRQVALKTVMAGWQDAEFLLHEAHAVAKLKHPNIVSIYEVGCENGRFYLANEFIDGLNLRDALSAGKPTQQRTVELALGIAKALAHAHEQGIIHRDIKPANIMLNTKGQPFVADFGLAKRMASAQSISSEGQVLGTALYMSPEQASGHASQTDGRSDLYSVGVILFEMLTGHLPFRGNAQAVLHQKTQQDAPSPRTLNPNLPKDLETLCLKCLERDPDKRYQSAGALVEELERFQAGLPINARPVSAPEKAWRWCLRHRAIAGLVAGLIVTLALGLLSVTHFALRSAANAQLANQRLYRAEMKVAAQYLANGDINGVRVTLARFETDSELARLRDFAWHYHKAAISPFLQVSNQGDPVVDVAVFPEGRFYAACGRNRELRVWDAQSGKRFRTLSLEGADFLSIAVSPANSHLASGSTDGLLRTWDPLNHDRPVRQIKHGPPVAFVRYSRTGDILLSAGTRGPVRIWEADTGELKTLHPTGMSGTKDVRFAPDGKSLAIATGDGIIRVRDIESGSILQLLESDSTIESLAFSDDGDILASGSYEGRIQLWSLKTGQPLFSYQTHLGIIGDLTFLKDSPLLVLPTVTGHLVVFDTKAMQETRQLITHNLTSGIVDLSLDGRILAVGSGGGTVKLLEVSQLIPPDIFWHQPLDNDRLEKGSENPVRAVAFFSDNRRLLAGSADGAIFLWDGAQGTSRTLLPANPEDQLLSLAWQEAGKLLAVNSRKAGVSLWRLEENALQQELDLGRSGTTAMGFASSTELIVIASEQGTLAVFDSSHWNLPLFEVTPGEGRINSLVFSPDERELVVAYQEGVVLVLEAKTGTPIGTPITVGSIPLSLTFCQGGETLAVGTDTGEIQLWEIGLRSRRQTIQAHASRVNVVLGFPEGNMLLSGGRDKDLKLWDVDSGELVTTLYGHRRQIVCLAISPDGNTVASGGLLGDVRLWRGPPH